MDPLQYGSSSVLYTPRALCMELQAEPGHNIPAPPWTLSFSFPSYHRNTVE